MKIYTKTGDKGKTGLIGGTRVSKSDVRLEAYGTIDELNAHIGLLMSLNISNQEVCFLQNIQNFLFSIGANLATDTEKTDYNNSSIVKEEDIKVLEKEIDRITSKLKPLENFILPSGSQTASQCHICRTVTRRAERRIVEMTDFYPIHQNLITYVNRLSDYFFSLARFVLKEEKKEEICWKKPK